MDHFDTIFFSEQRAKKIAKKRNKLKKDSNKIQLCYYFGNKKDKNLIPLSFDNLENFFLDTNLRWPSHCDFIDSSFEDNEQKQQEIVKAIAYIFEQVKNKKIILLNKLTNKYKNIKSKEKNILFFATKNDSFLYKYVKQEAKRFKKQGFKTKIICEKSNKKFIIDEVQSIDVFNTINRFKPGKIVFFNDFKPQMHNKNIKITYYITSFKKIYEIVESEEEFDTTNVEFFVINYYQQLLLKDIGIKSKKFVFNKKFKTKNHKKTIKFLFLEDALSKDNLFFALHSMLDDIEQYLKDGNFLNMDKLIEFIKTKTYYNDYEDWELNIFVLKVVLVSFFANYLQSNKEVAFSGVGWDKTKIKIEGKIFKKPKKALSRAKYVLYINYPIVTLKLDDIIANGAIPIVYDIREDDKFYDKNYDKKCIFFKNIDELNSIMEKA